MAEQLKETNIQGQIIICSECLVEGDLGGDTLSQFWDTRANYIAKTYSTTSDDYYKKCVSGFETIINLPGNSEVCLWFENDLFCQANMWFIFSLLNRGQNHKVFRVFPVIENKEHLWKGFGNSTSQKLEQAYNSKVSFAKEDLILGESLWNAFKTSDFEGLSALSRKQSHCFQYLAEVCQAHIDRFPSDKSLGRPEREVKDIMQSTSKDFQTVFSEFSERQGVYGFSDLQVTKMFDEVGGRRSEV